MTLWLGMVVMCIAALWFVVWPLYRGAGRMTPLVATLIVLVAGGSVLLYQQIGQPDAPSAAAGTADSTEVVDALAARLEENPDDAEGWVLLGRSYQALDRFDEAIAAFETAMELEEGKNGSTMVSLAIAIMESRNGSLTARSASLFENALAVDPGNQNALFYAGSVAADRGDLELAASRWEALLQQGVPPEIGDSLQRQINQWRGLPAPEMGATPPGMANPHATPAPGASPGAADAIVSMNVSLSLGAAAAMPDNARVFVIARDPNAPSPPIAVVPLQLVQLPAVVNLDDSNTMVAGRPLSGFAEFEVLARVSLSGSPAAQSGDWYGSKIVTAGNTAPVDLVIDQQVP